MAHQLSMSMGIKIRQRQRLRVIEKILSYLLYDLL